MWPLHRASLGFLTAWQLRIVRLPTREPYRGTEARAPGRGCKEPCDPGSEVRGCPFCCALWIKAGISQARLGNGLLLMRKCHACTRRGSIGGGHLEDKPPSNSILSDTYSERPPSLGIGCKLYHPHWRASVNSTPPFQCIYHSL